MTNSEKLDSLTTLESASWPHEVLKRFRLIFKAVQTQSARVESFCGISSAQLWILWELEQSPGLCVSDLAKAMAIHHSTASNLLDKLEKKELILRNRVNRDQRVVTLTLTPAGAEILKNAPLPHRGLLQEALFHLPVGTLHHLAECMDLLIKEMAIKNETAAMEPINPLNKRA